MAAGSQLPAVAKSLPRDAGKDPRHRGPLPIRRLGDPNLQQHDRIIGSGAEPDIEQRPSVSVSSLSPLFSVTPGKSLPYSGSQCLH